MAIEDDFSFVFVEDSKDLFGIRLGVDGNLLFREGFARFAFARRVANLARKIADEEDDLVPHVLELAQFAQNDEMPEMEVGRRWIGAQFDAQWLVFCPALFELFLKLLGNMVIDDTAEKDFELFFDGQK